MNNRLDFSIGPDDDAALASAARYVGKADIHIDCIPDDRTHPDRVTAHVRRRLEHSLRWPLFVRSYPSTRHLHIPRVPPHLWAPIDPDTVATGDPSLPGLGDFFRRYGGWYAFSQIGEEHFNNLAARMRRRIQDGDETLGECHETLFHVTMDMLRQSFRAFPKYRMPIFFPGIDPSFPEGGIGRMRKTLADGHETRVEPGKPNITFLHRARRVAEFDAAMVVPLDHGSRIVLLDATKADEDSNCVLSRFLEKQDRNKRFLERHVLEGAREQYAFATVASRSGAISCMPDDILMTDHRQTVCKLDQLMTIAIQSTEPDKYLLFRELADKE